MPILIHSFHERLSADTHSENELLAKYLPQQIDALFCRIYESLKVLGIRIRPLELYLRTPLRTSFFSLRDVTLNHRISAYYNTKSKVEKLWRAFRRRRSKIIITHFRITSNEQGMSMVW